MINDDSAYLNDQPVGKIKESNNTTPVKITVTKKFHGNIVEGLSWFSDVYAIDETEK